MRLKRSQLLIILLLLLGQSVKAKLLTHHHPMGLSFDYPSNMKIEAEGEDFIRFEGWVGNLNFMKFGIGLEEKGHFLGWTYGYYLREGLHYEQLNADQMPGAMDRGSFPHSGWTGFLVKSIQGRSSFHGQRIISWSSILNYGIQLPGKPI